MQLRWVMMCAVAALGWSQAIGGPVEIGARLSDEFVAAHNEWRSGVNVGPVRWSSDLARSAKLWANSLARRGCRLQHSRQPGVGENLFFISARQTGRIRQLVPVTPTEVVGAWGEESRYYSYSRNRCSGGRHCGHYTQIVWRDTREIGCALAVCEDSGQIWVCQYSPAGNAVGRRPVLRLLGDFETAGPGVAAWQMEQVPGPDQRLGVALGHS